MRTRLATDQDVPAVLAMMVDFNRHEHIDGSPVAGEPVLRRLIDDPTIGLCCLLEDEGGARCVKRCRSIAAGAVLVGAPPEIKQEDTKTRRCRDHEATFVSSGLPVKPPVRARSALRAD